jgi:NitT/TauT family transport system substrate-binding protein
VEAGIGNDAAIVETAIPNCNIVFVTGAEMKAALENLYNILAEVQPKAIGGKLPDEGFYLQ